MLQELVAHAEITIHAPVANVWDALINPEIIKKYMFGTETISDWKEGSPIVWKGMWEGKSYIDKGIILKIEAEKILSYSHFSTYSGLPDVPENYHTVTITLAADGSNTRISLVQDNNSNESARQQSEKVWGMFMDGLKKVVETNQ